MTAELPKELKAAIAPLKTKLDEIVGERARLETNLLKLQDKLRKIDARRDPTGHATTLGEVNATKAEIGRISVEHADYARAISLISGGKNFAPLP